MVTIRHREEVLNTVFAQALFAHGIKASPESIEHKGKERPDVILTFRGLRCAIEGKVADVQGAQKEVSKNAAGRVEIGVSQLAIAVVYPKSFRSTPFENLPRALRDAEYEFCVFSENGPGEWKTGGLNAILDELRRAHEILARDDAVQEAAEELSQRLEGVAKIFIHYPAICDKLTELLGIGKPRGESKDIAAKRRETAAKIAALTVANAFIFEEQLAESEQRVKNLRDILRTKDFVTVAAKHWDYICEDINYVPIFKVAAEILSQLPSGTPSEGAVKELANQALAISARKAALRHDLMGRIYHWLLHDAKYLGTYYTSVSAATLLLKVALDPKKWKVDFSREADLEAFKVADLACGTGTLLMASSQVITDNFVRQSVARKAKLTNASFRKLHKALMENIIHGYDVLTSAIHLTASTLSLLAPEIAFRKMHLYSMPMGTKGKQIHLGSIDFLSDTEVKTQMNLWGEYDAESEVSEVTGKGLKGSTAPLPQLDLCVMNPPFVRSVGGNLLFGSLPDVRGVMQAELKKVLNPKDRPPLLANVTAGLGSVFVAVGDRYIKPGGRIALVLPAALTTGVAWGDTRKLLRERYILEAVIASHHADRWSFSENTELSEVLVVARKKTSMKDRADAETLFVNLWGNPHTSGDALAIAAEINTRTPAKLGTSIKPDYGVCELKVGSHKYGEMLSIPRKETDDSWRGCVFAQTDLVRAAWHLRHGNVIVPGAKKSSAVRVVSMGSLADLGPDRRDIHDGFIEGDSPSPYPAFWGHDADKVLTLEVSPNKWLAPRAKAAKGRHLRDVSLLWPKAGRLLIAERMWLVTQRLVAVSLPDYVLSNVWWPVRLKSDDRRKEKVLALWLNSTLGLILMFAGRVPTRGPWVQFKKPLLAEMLILDVDSLPKKTLEDLANAFDAVSKLTLHPLAELSVDEVRRDIDKAIAEVLSLPDLTPIREMLGREPILTNKAIFVEKPSAPAATDEVEQLGLELDPV